MLGARGRDSWVEIWHIIGPQIEQVMAGRGATWHENQLVPIFRHGVLDDVYWTYSYGPIDDEKASHGVGGVLVLCTETTSQVLAQEHLRAAESRWRALFDLAPGFVCVLDGPDFRYEYANPQYLRLVGRSAVVGHTVLELFPEVKAQGFIDLLDGVYRSGAPYVAASVPLQIARADGGAPQTQYIDFVYQPIKDASGAVTGIFVEGADVTVRVNAELALRASESRFRIMADGVAVLIWVTRIGGDVEFVNREFRDYFRTTYEEVRRDGWQRFVHPDDLAAFDEAFAHARSAAARFSLRTRVRHASGEWRWLDHTAVPRFDADGTYLGHVGSGIDVTELVTSQEALADAARRKDDFLATLSHELRNPLAAILSASNLVGSAHADASEPIKRAAGIIERQAHSMAQLLNDLLDISRITRGVLVVKRERVQLAAVVDAALEVTRPAIERKQHALTCEPAPAGRDARRRSVAHHAGGGQSPQQCGQVHGCGRAPGPVGARRRRGSVHCAARQRRRHPAGGVAAAVPDVRAGRVASRSLGRGARHRARAGQGRGGDPRRPRRGVQRGPRQGQRIPPLAAARRRARAGGGRRRHGAARHAPRAAHPHRGRQRGCGRDAGHHRPDVGARRPRRPRRTGGVGHRARLRAGHRIRGHRDAGHLRLRRVRADARGSKLAAIRLVAVSGWGQAEDKRRARESGFDLHLTKPVVASVLFSIIDGSG